MNSTFSLNNKSNINENGGRVHKTCSVHLLRHCILEPTKTKLSTCYIFRYVFLHLIYIMPNHV